MLAEIVAILKPAILVRLVCDILRRLKGDGF